MTWVKLDVQFFRNPKVLACSPGATMLYVAGLCWCKAQGVDGVIPRHVLPLLAAEAKASTDDASELVDNGLWNADDVSYRVPDWCEWNMTAEERRALSEKRAEAGRRGRRKQLAEQPPGNLPDNEPSKERAEVEVEKEKENKPPPTPPRGEREWISNGCTFEAFWDTYPRQAAEGTARKAWKQAVAKEGTPTPIVEGARRYANDPNLPELRFVPEPAKWLEAERWKDGPLPARGSSGSLADQLTAAALRGDDGRG